MSTVVIPIQRGSASFIAPYIEITTKAGEEVDWRGLQSMRVRLQLGAADELEITITAQNMDGEWRPDMPLWQIGGTLKVISGYDGAGEHIQTFEIISTTNSYGSGEDVPMMTIRAVSELARAARNRNSRIYSNSHDFEIVTRLSSEYGWANGVPVDDLIDQDLDLKSIFSKSGRTKAQGTSDLELLKQIASNYKLGGPRVDETGALIMPKPSADDPIVFIRGTVSGDIADALFEDSYALLSFSPSREGGSDNIQLSIVGWNPETKTFVEKVFQADEFGGDPKVVYTGTLATASIASESSTRGLTLQVIAARGWSVNERRDVLATGRYVNETDATALANRWFNLRERLGRWATIEVEGHPGLKPYRAIVVDGDMAVMDKGYWLPTVVEHNWGDSGWTTRLTCIRVVEDSTISEAPKD